MVNPSNLDPGVGGIKIHTLEIVHPGVAFPWSNTATGLKITTNLSSDIINNRTNKPIIFSTDSEVWGWAQRIRSTRID